MPIDPPLTDKDRLLAALIGIDQLLPGGYVVAMKVRLEECIEAVEQLFLKHNLPMRDQVVAELTMWRCHAEEGLKVMRHSEHALHAVIRSVKNPVP